MVEALLRLVTTLIEFQVRLVVTIWTLALSAVVIAVSAIGEFVATRRGENDADRNKARRP
jgi:hypothetical protein